MRLSIVSHFGGVGRTSGPSAYVDGCDWLFNFGSQIPIEASCIGESVIGALSANINAHTTMEYAAVGTEALHVSQLCDT